MDFSQWWQTANTTDIATVAAAIVAVLALIWAVFTYLVPRGGKKDGNKITAKNGSIAAGGNVNIGSPSDKT